MRLDLCRALAIRPDERLWDAVLPLLRAHPLRTTGPASNGSSGSVKVRYLNIPGTAPAFLELLAAGVECTVFTDKPP